MFRSVVLFLILVLFVDTIHGYCRLPTTSSRMRNPLKTPNKVTSLPLKATSIPKSPSFLSSKPSAKPPSNAMNLLPENPHLIRGVLSNGLQYLLLPTSHQQQHSKESHSPGTLEARLELLIGSTAETDKQLGMAHLLEHVVFMDNPIRKQLSTTGMQTNAYTDFHQTVFTASSASSSSVPAGNTPLLPAILQSFREIFTFGHDVACGAAEGCLAQGVCNKTHHDTITPSAAWKDCLRRLQKEQTAILSESNLVNGVQYRHESEILSSLHQENLLSKRFPLGDMEQVQHFTPQDLLQFHHQHYIPRNALLYLTGDVHEYGGDTAALKRVIEQTFGDLPIHQIPHVPSTGRTQNDRLFPSTMASISRHFPPITHTWSSNRTATQIIVDNNQHVLNKLQQADQKDNANSPTHSPDLMHARDSPHVHLNALRCRMKTWVSAWVSKPPFKTSLPSPIILKQNYSKDLVTVRVFAKRPIETITSVQRFRNNLMRKIVLNALSVRMHLSNSRRRDQTSQSSLEWQNMPREGCAVTAFQVNVDLVSSHASETKTEAKTDTKGDVSTVPLLDKTLVEAFTDVRNLGKFGITEAEFQRIKNMLLYDAKKFSTQTVSPDEEMEALMTAEACGHTHLEPSQQYVLTKEALQGHDTITDAMGTFTSPDTAITLSEINTFAKEFLEFLKPNNNDVLPSAIVISTPSSVTPSEDQSLNHSSVDGKIADIVKSILQSSSEDLHMKPPPPIEFAKPLSSLLSIDKKNELFSTVSVGDDLSGAETTVPTPVGTVKTKHLKNGLRVNILTTTASSNRDQISIRLDVHPPPSMTSRVVTEGKSLLLTELGVRMLQNGGNLLNHTRPEVELFCIENDISVDTYTRRSSNKHILASQSPERTLGDVISPLPLYENLGSKSNYNSSTAREKSPFLDNGFTIDIMGPLTPPGLAAKQDKDLLHQTSGTTPTPLALSGPEILVQLLHGLVTDFQYNTSMSLNALMKQLRREERESKQQLETACLSEIQQALFGMNRHFNLSDENILRTMTDGGSSDRSMQSLGVQNVQTHMSQLLDPRHMTLTVATSSDTHPILLEEIITTYASSWPLHAANTPPPPTPTHSHISHVPTPVPTRSPTGAPTDVSRPTNPPQARWRRDSKENARRRQRIRRGNRPVFWLPNGTFPGGWFYGVPDFALWENVTVVPGTYYDPHIRGKVHVQPTVESTRGVLPNTSANTMVHWVPSHFSPEGLWFPGGWFYNVIDPHDNHSNARLGVPFSTKIIQDVIKNAQRSSPTHNQAVMEVFVEDSVQRGIGYLAGYGPTSLGQFPPRSQEELVADQKRHPLFGFVSLMLMQEMINQKLHQVVREERDLSYDASFELHSSVFHSPGTESVLGRPTDWYTIAVTAAPSPMKIREALSACQSALNSLVTDPHQLTAEILEHFKHSIHTELVQLLKRNELWVHLASLLPSLAPSATGGGTSAGDQQLPTALFATLDNITIADMRTMLERMNFQENMLTCVGVSSPALPSALA